MKIGFLDIDNYSVLKFRRPNLELMKISSYYKSLSKENKIEIIDDIKKKDNYDLIYVFKNKSYSKTSILERGLKNSNNTFNIGYCFNNNTWAPLNDNIEKMEPDLEVYSPIIRKEILFSNKSWDGASRKLTFFTDYYSLRYCYPNWNYNLNKNIIKDRGIYLHDFEFWKQPNWQDIYLELYKCGNNKLEFYNDFLITNINDFEFIGKHIRQFSRSKYIVPSQFIITFPEFKTDFIHFFNEYKKLLREFYVNTLITYVTDSQNPNEDKLKETINCFDMMMYSIQNGVHLLLKYDKAEKENMYSKLSKEISYYSLFKRRETLYDRLYERIGIKNPELFQYYFSLIEDRFPRMAEKMKTCERGEVKDGIIPWIYGDY